MITAPYRVFGQLLKKDFLAFKRTALSKLFDTLCLFLTNVLVFGYFMRFIGAGESYPAFFVVGSITSFGLIEIVGKVGVLIADIHGSRTIYYWLGLPIHPRWLFCYIALSWAMTSTIISALMFPIGKLLVFHGLDLTAISYVRLLPIFVTAQLFFGFFALWLASVLKNLVSLNSLWLRYIAPMWMFGGYTFSWEAAYQAHPVLGYCLLVNPMLYVMEGMRAAALGQTGYLPYWVCLTVLWVVILGCAFRSISLLKKRLDSV